MASSPHLWYVQTGFGTVLGPMPDDALAEMTRTGALIATDLVRRGTEGTWCLASETPGLFGCSTESVPLVANAAYEASNSDLPLTLPLSGSVPAKDLLSAEADLIETWKSERPRNLIKANECLLAQSNELTSETNDNSAITDAFETTPNATPASDVEPTFVSTIESRSLGRRQTVLKPWPQSEHFALKSRGWKHGFPRWRISCGVVVVVLIATWCVWPRSVRRSFDRVEAIWKELQTRRSDINGEREWGQFLVRSNAELDDLVPWLEKTASSREPDKQLLLRVVRYLRRILKNNPKETGLPEERYINIWLADIRATYGLSPVLPTNNSSIAP